jgi:general secretion pathway protein A
MTGVELLRNINQEFGIDAASDCANDLLNALNSFLLGENRQGRTVVLVIDEAQNLQADVLEEVRLISNLETENDKLIQIILAGQPELETILQRRDLRQLNQRIAVRYKLRSMTRDETRTYIRHRMDVAGAAGGVVFSRMAIALIHLYSRGVPRMINILCDRALLIAYGDEYRSITVATIFKSICELLNLLAGRRLVLVCGGITLIVLIIMLAQLLADRLPAWLNSYELIF